MLPLKREWKDLNRRNAGYLNQKNKKMIKSNDDENEIYLMSWNLLADSLVDPQQQHKLSSKDCLQWEFRKKLIQNICKGKEPNEDDDDSNNSVNASSTSASASSSSNSSQNGNIASGKKYEIDQRKKLTKKYQYRVDAPDIICLQELDEEGYNEDLKPDLSKTGYESIFKKRTSDKIIDDLSTGEDDDDAAKPKSDGVAIFWNSNKFHAEKHGSIECKIPGHQIMDRDNVMAWVILTENDKLQRDEEDMSDSLAQTTSTLASSSSSSSSSSKRLRNQRSRILVATTHLLFNPARGDIKLNQLHHICDEIERIRERYFSAENPCHLILCGDFNMLPFSPLYKLMVSGESSLAEFAPLNSKRHDRRELSGQRIASIISRHKMVDPNGHSGSGTCLFPPKSNHFHQRTFNTSNFKIPPYISADLLNKVFPLGYGLRSAYFENRQITSHSNQIGNEISRRSTGEPAYTTLHSQFRGTVDYVFYQTWPNRQLDNSYNGPTLTVSKILEMPHFEIVDKQDFHIPSEVWPSDHFSLNVKFKIV